MNTGDYGMLHMIHKLREAEMLRSRRGQVYGFNDSAHPVDSLITRLRRVLRRREAPAHLTRYEPVRLNG